MTKDELIRLIDGPLAAYFAGGVSLSYFFELVNVEFGHLDLDKTVWYPLMLNIDIAPKESPESAPEGMPADVTWDYMRLGEAYLAREELSVVADACTLENSTPTLTDKEVYYFLACPMAAYLSGACGYPAFVERLRETVPGLSDLTVPDLYPRLFNYTVLDVTHGEDMLSMWDIWKSGQEFVANRQCTVTWHMGGETKGPLP